MAEKVATIINLKEQVFQKVRFLKFYNFVIFLSGRKSRPHAQADPLFREEDRPLLDNGTIFVIS